VKKYIVELTPEERSELKQIIDASRMAAHKRRHAWMLLKADQGEHGPGWADTRVAEAFDASALTVKRLRRRCVEFGIDAALEHGNRGAYRVKALDGKAEAHVIALACGEPPAPGAGRNRWTLELLADRAVALGITESCSKSSLHRALKKTPLSLT
jgi:homeodomain-containing protein